MAFTNPPAFPCEAQPDRDNIPPEHDYIQTGVYSGKFPGMTLRDWFATQAPVTLLDAALCCGWADLNDANMPSDSARTTLWVVMTLMRYEYADAMLEERTKAQQP